MFSYRIHYTTAYGFYGSRHIIIDANDVNDAERQFNDRFRRHGYVCEWAQFLGRAV